MELYAKGQLSFLILTCMKERDFYGLDIISAISDKSNGKINLKKPSVYSNLTRMEKQGYISSYLKSSDFGPNRKYYSLTEKGRNFYQELKDYYDRNNIDVFKVFSEDDSPAVESKSFLEEEMSANVQPASHKEEQVDKQVDAEEEFFDFSFEENDDKEDEGVSINEQNSCDPPIQPQVHQSPTPVYSIKQVLTQKEELQVPTEPQEKKVDNGIFLSQESADQYNKKIYDISRDINKYRKKRSFAEDQIAMTATNPLAESKDKAKTNIEDFKNALMQNKDKYQPQRLNHDDFMRKMGYRADAKTPEQEEIKNDAVFITNRLEREDVDYAKKIEPPRLQVVVENSKDDKLPAPKRDVSIDPSHKEILSQLYGKTRDNTSQVERQDSLYDYNDLKDYYAEQNLSFNIYQKPTRKVKHNTNKLYMIISIITFLLASVSSLAIYLTLNSLDKLNTVTNFLYFVLPVPLLIEMIYRIYKFKKSRGWIPKDMISQFKMWTIFLAYLTLVVVVNLACGLIGQDFALYATTFILPIFIGGIVLPIRYYIKRFALVKFWK